MKSSNGSVNDLPQFVRKHLLYRLELLLVEALFTVGPQRSFRVIICFSPAKEETRKAEQRMQSLSVASSRLYSVLAFLRFWYMQVNTKGCGA